MAKKKKTTGNIFSSVLSPSELGIWDEIDTGASKQLDLDIKILTIRERRILERIQKLEAGAFTVTKISEDNTSSGPDLINKISMSSESNIELIRQAEETLTKIQVAKARLIEAKIKLEAIMKEDDKPDISIILNAINGAASQVWEENSDE